MTKNKKAFILDTSVILHKLDVIKSFKNHDVYIALPVLKQVDAHKKDRGEVGFIARHFIKSLEDEVRPDNVKFIFEGADFRHVALDDAVDTKLIDYVSTVRRKAEENGVKYEDIVIVTNDTSLSIVASKYFNVSVETYKTDETDDLTGVGDIRSVRLDDSQIDLISKCEFELKRHMNVGDDIPNIENTYFKVRQHGSDQGIVAKLQDGKLKMIETRTQPFGLSPRNIEQKVLVDALLDKSIPCVVVNGKAGVGKTICTLAAGFELMGIKKGNGSKHPYQVMSLSKPIQSIGKEMGFLPGDMQEKMDPWLQSFYDNADFLLRKSKVGNTVTDLITRQQLEVAPISYMRGRSILDRFVIVDEMQNATPHIAKTIVSRIGDSSKLVILGDISQIDDASLNKNNNALAYTMKKLYNMREICVLNMGMSVRSRLCDIAATYL